MGNVDALKPTTFNDYANFSNSTSLPKIGATGNRHERPITTVVVPTSGFNVTTGCASPEMSATHLVDAGTVFLVIAYGLVFALSVTGNVTVLYVIRRHLHCRTSANVFIAVLSLSDLIAAVICAPTTAAMLLLPVSRVTSFICVFDGVVGCISGLLSTAMLFLIAVDRYVTTVRQRTTPFGVRSTSVVVAIATSGSILLACTWYVLRATVLSDDSGHAASACLLMDGRRRFQLIYVVVAAGCPSIAMFYCVARLFKLIVRSANVVRPANTPANQLLFYDEMETAMTVVVMVAVFIACRLSEFALTLLFVVMETRPPVSSFSYSLSIDAAASLVVLANGAVNPLVYALRNPNLSQFIRLDLGILQQQNRRRKSYFAESVVSTTTAAMTSPTVISSVPQRELKFPAERAIADVTGASPTVMASRVVNEIGSHQLRAYDVTSSTTVPDVVFKQCRTRKSSLSSNRTTSTIISIAF